MQDSCRGILSQLLPRVSEFFQPPPACTHERRFQPLESSTYSEYCIVLLQGDGFSHIESVPSHQNRDDPVSRSPLTGTVNKDVEAQSSLEKGEKERESTSF
jgi:hypothetical protein